MSKILRADGEHVPPVLSPMRIFLGELLAAWVLTGVTVASTTAFASTSDSSIRTLLGSLLLGTGFGLVVWTFGSYFAAQVHPMISLLMLLMGANDRRTTGLRLAAQTIGAVTGGALVGRLSGLPHGGASLAARPWIAEGVIAFLFSLVALSVAHHRDVRAPVALGAFGTMAFWMTGQPTLGNPVLLGALSQLHDASRFAVWASLGAEVVGFSLGALVAFALNPQAQHAVNVLLFTPRTR